MVDGSMMNAHALMDYIIKCTPSHDSQGVKLSGKAKKLLASLIQDWIYDYVVTGEKPTTYDHEKSVLIVQSFYAGYIAGKRDDH